MANETSIDPTIGQIFKKYRKKQINYLTGKAWTLNDLSIQISTLIQEAFEGSEEGLSSSAISRLENGSLLPRRRKLKILADFLNIPNAELKPHLDFDSGQAFSSLLKDHYEHQRVNELASISDKTAIDWLMLLSSSNIAGLYYKSLEWAEDGLFALESSILQKKSKAISTVRALIQSKKNYAQYCLDKKRDHYLTRSLEWANQANRALEDIKHDKSWESSYLYLEAARSILTASLELFNYRFVLNPQFNSQEIQEVDAYYNLLKHQFQNLDKKIHLSYNNVQNDKEQVLLELYIYFLRENDRFHLKWLEVLEMHHSSDYLFSKFNLKIKPQSLSHFAIFAYFKLKSSPKPMLFILDNLYTCEKNEIILCQQKKLTSLWSDLKKSMLNTLSQYHNLESPHATKGYQESIIFLPLAAARVGEFDEVYEHAILNIAYMQTQTSKRPLWFYVRACCYAYRYRQSQNEEDLNAALENWLRYTDGSLNSDEVYQDSFNHLLSEPILWSTFFPLILNKSHDSELASWFVNALNHLMEQSEYKNIWEKFTA